MSINFNKELIDAAFAVVMCGIILLDFICVMRED